MLEKIIELQTHQPAQFEELGLPLAIKRLAWEKDAEIFGRITAPPVEKYISSEYAPKMIAASQQVQPISRSDEKSVSQRNERPTEPRAVFWTNQAGSPLATLTDQVTNKSTKEARKQSKTDPAQPINKSANQPVRLCKQPTE